MNHTILSSPSRKKFYTPNIIYVGMSRTRKCPDEFQKFLLLDDVRDYHPANDAYVFVARSLLNRKKIEQIQGELEEFIGIKAFLVSIEQKNILRGKFSYENFTYAGRSYFENDGHYITGETFEYDNFNFEIIVNDRSFNGLDLSYYEPTDRLVIYLNLHRKENEWINPYTEEIIIKTGDSIRSWEPHDSYVSIRKSELIDYLAARRCGLVLFKYVRRSLYTPFEFIGLPTPFNDKQTKYGRQSWVIDRSPTNRDSNMYFSQLWESFWIEPASSPRRWDAQPPEEFKDGVPFLLGNGELTTYKQDEKDRYFELLSFKPSLFKSFLSLPNNKIVFSCLSNLTLHYADASYLDGCINHEGQFQVFFGLVAKLDVEKQRQLRAFSEPMKAKPSYEYIRTYINAQVPETMPLILTLSNCLRDINFLWQRKFGETLLLNIVEDALPISILIGPTSNDFDELADVMLELQKALIPESKIDNIKKQLNYAPYASDPRSYKEMRSIGYIRLFFRINKSDKTEGESYILKVINQLRNCKGHPKNIDKVLIDFSIPATSPRASFLYIMAEFCTFLLAFKTLTERVLGVTIKSLGNIEDPWRQLKISRNYFLNPF